MGFSCCCFSRHLPILYTHQPHPHPNFPCLFFSPSSLPPRSLCFRSTLPPTFSELLFHFVPVTPSLSHSLFLTWLLPSFLQAAQVSPFPPPLSYCTTCGPGSLSLYVSVCLFSCPRESPALPAFCSETQPLLFVPFPTVLAISARWRAPGLGKRGGRSKC